MPTKGNKNTEEGPKPTKKDLNMKDKLNSALADSKAEKKPTKPRKPKIKMTEPQEQKAVAEAPKEISAPEKKEAEAFPKNSRLYVSFAYSYLNGNADKTAYPTLESYLDFWHQTIKNKDTADGQSLKILAGQGIVSEADCFAVLPEDQISLEVGTWISNETNEETKTKYQNYLNYLLNKPEIMPPPKSPGQVPEAGPKKSTRTPDKKLELNGKPEFKFDSNIGRLSGTFSIKDDPYKQLRKISVGLPDLAKVDLTAQMPKLEQALQKLMEVNNFRANPKIKVAEVSGAKRLVFYYGNDSQVFELSSNAIEQNLKKHSVDFAKKPIDLDRYLKAKEFYEQHKDDKFTEITGDVRDDIVDTSQLTRRFEDELLNMPTGVKDSRKTIKEYSKDAMLEKLWRESLTKEELEKLTKALGAKKITPPVVSPDKTKTDAGKQNKWTEALPYGDEKFKKNAEIFLAGLEKKFAKDWHKVFSEKKVFIELCKTNQLALSEGLKVAAGAFIKENPQAIDVDEFNELLSLNHKDLQQKLKDAHIEANGTTFDQLLAFLAEKAKPAPDAVTNGETGEDSSSSEDEGDSKEYNEDEEESSESTDSSGEENGESEGSDAEIPDNVLEIVGEIMEENSELTLDLISEATGLSGEKLDEFLEKALADLGRDEDFETGYKEYLENYGKDPNAESKQALMLRAVQEYYLLKQVREKREQGAVKNEQPEKVETANEDIKKEDKNPEKEDPKKEKLKGVPDYLEEVKSFTEPPCVLLKDKVSAQEYFAVLGKDGKVFTVPMPKDSDIEDAEQRKALAESFGKFLESNKNNLAPGIALEGKIIGSHSDRLDMVLSLGNKKVLQDQFLDNSLLREDQKKKPGQNPYFKILLLERLYKFRDLGDKATPDDKKQIDLTVAALQSLLEAPLKEGLGFSQASVLSAFEEFRKSGESKPNVEKTEDKNTAGAQPAQRAQTPRPNRQNNRGNRPAGNNRRR